MSADALRQSSFSAYREAVFATTQKRLAEEPQQVAATKSLLDPRYPKEGTTDLRGWEGYYLRSRPDQSELFLPHPAAAKAADWSPDGLPSKSIRSIMRGVSPGRSTRTKMASGPSMRFNHDPA